MKTTLKKVPTEGITAKEVLALWRKGDLYCKAEAEEISQEQLLRRCRQETLDYVSAINCFATAEWRPHIEEIWKAIVSDDLLASRLLMKQKHVMNRYFVTSLVFNMQALGVYLPVEQVSMLRLHLRLEGVDVRNSVFNNCGNYPVTLALRRRLSALIREKTSSIKFTFLDPENSPELCTSIPE